MNSTSKPTIVPGDITNDAPAQSGTLARMARRALLERLARLQDGEIRLQDASGAQRFGARTARCGLSATISVRDPEFYSLAAFGGTVGAGESYINGHWQCDDLTALVRIMVQNRHVMEGLESGVGATAARLARRALHWVNRNSRSGSARNIAAHYDLGNELYKLMLDDTMAYSCGIFLHDDATLHEASIAKFDAVCRKLALTSSDHLVEIGTGWGGLAIHAAEQYGCRVTTTTISREQHDFAKEKIAARGLSGRITLLFEDYRDLKGQFDKLVSIEMIEAVGARYLDTYFAKCSSLLKASGAMLLQAITLQDQYYARALRSVDYIQRFVFPGQLHPVGHGHRRIGDPRDRHEAVQPRGHRPALRADAAHVAREVLRQHRPGAQPGLSGELCPPVGVLPLLLRGWLCRAATGRRADAADQAGLPPRGHRRGLRAWSHQWICSGACASWWAARRC